MTGDEQAVPYFDGHRVELIDPPWDAASQAAYDAFMALGPAARLTHTRHVAAYRADVLAMEGKDTAPLSDTVLWSQVAPEVFGVEERDGAHYVFVECECAWEAEHGLMLVDADALIIKAGAYDGHVTNANAFADESLRDVVYYANNPDLTTYRDKT